MGTTLITCAHCQHKVGVLITLESQEDEDKVALTLQGFGVAFGRRVILACINLSVPKRGSTNLVGPAGTGKSTLIRTLAGLNDAQPAMRTWGVVEVDGAVVPSKYRRKADRRGAPAGVENRRRIGLVLQDARFLTATVRENLASGLNNRSSLTRAEQEERLEATLASNQLSELIDHLDEDAISLPPGLQRRLAIIRAALSCPAVLCADECSAGLSSEEAIEVVSLLALQARERAVVFVTHNQAHARALGGRTVLLAGGRIQEETDTEDFFLSPVGAAAQSFVRTGNCSVPGPNAKKEDLADWVEPPPTLPASARAVAASRYVGPNGFFWLRPGQLGGLPRPGIVATLDDDLAGLKRLGVTVLITLEEEQTVAPRACSDVAIHCRFFPIVDMMAPSSLDAATLCKEIDAFLEGGEVVALHCRAGLGRTGTMLACHLIWRGVVALEAFETVRRINPLFIQSDEQIDFLSRFAASLKQNRDPTNSATINNHH